MDKLRIVLIEDTEIHRQAAIKQLAGHDLIVCDNFAQFQDKAKELVGKIDVVLTDCLMPPEARAYVPQENHSQELVPFGPLALLWAIQNNIPKAGLLMLNNHHDHPIAAGLDILGAGRREVRKYGNTDVLISTNNFYGDAEDGEYYSSNVTGQKGNYVKLWDLFLERLMNPNTNRFD